MIRLTEQAVEKLKQVQSSENKAGYALRVSVTGGGCSGMSYKLDFSQEVKASDKVFDANGIKVVVDPKSHLFLDGLTLDYSGGLNGKGFVFDNPNAKKSCGCGSSFGV